MSRAQRLLELLQILRRHRRPVAGTALADELGISLRTLYRDIAALQAQGANIEGEPGLGYILRPGFMLPPLMFTEEEIEALVLGSRWVAERADVPLGNAARDALSKITAVLPPELRESLDATTLLVPPGAAVAASDVEMAAIRHAIRTEHKLAIRYRSADARETERTIWPFAIAYFDHARVIAAWCELRGDFRNFRTDRIVSLANTPVRYPKRRQALLKEWSERNGEPRYSD